jgi:epoxyqueuosine reductase QueG
MSEAVKDEIKSEEYYKSRVDEIATACFDVIFQGVSIEPQGQIRWRIAARVATAIFAHIYKPSIETVFTNKPVSREVAP